MPPSPPCRVLPAGGWIRRTRLASRVEQLVRELRIKATSTKQLVKYLSGGNQQKVVLARWLLSQCRVYLFDEPTRGVDVAGKREIYRLLEDLARQGAGILMISSDLPEVLTMSDRILVVREGRIVKELARGEATQETILRYAVGQAVAESGTLAGYFSYVLLHIPPCTQGGLGGVLLFIVLFRTITIRPFRISSS